MIINREKLLYMPVIILFIFILVFPTMYRSIVGFLLIIAIFSSCIIKVKIDLKIYLWNLFYILFGIILIIRAIILDTPGAIDNSKVFIIWIAIYMILSTVIKEQKQIIKLLTIFNIVSIANFIIYFLGFLFYLKLLNFNIIGTLGYTIDPINGKYNLPNISTTVFLLPFYTTIIIYSKINQVKFNKSITFFIIISFLFNLFMAYQSGRRAILLELIFIPVLIFVLDFKRRIIIKLACFFTIILFITYIYIFFFDHNLYEYFSNIFTSNHRDILSNQIRVQQFKYLNSAWLNNFWFGKGIGSSVDMIRDKNMPWAYELSYNALLMQIGILGFFIYLIGVLYLVIQLRQITIHNRNNIYGIIIGAINISLLCFLIANATNPYLMKFSSLWVLFLPVGIINYYKVYK